MDSKNPLVRLSIYGRLKRVVGSYKDRFLENTDRRIFRGIYQRRLKDYDEELIE